MKNLLDTPSRAYVRGPDGASVGTVGEEYDAWTEEGILEYYWGEHIHLGYYTDEDMAKGAGTLAGCNVKDFIEAKFDFVDKMLEWSECLLSRLGFWTWGAASAARRGTSPKPSVRNRRSRASPCPRTSATARRRWRRSRASITHRFKS